MKHHFEIEPTFERVYSFLKEVDCDFIPPLSARLNIEEYSKKLSEQATNVYLSLDDLDIGHAAIYVSDEGIFISSIAILEIFRGQGKAEALLQYVLDIGRQQAVKKLSLEVSKLNTIALKFYLRNGFKIRRIDLENLLLEKEI